MFHTTDKLLHLALSETTKLTFESATIFTKQIYICFFAVPDVYWAVEVECVKKRFGARTTAHSLHQHRPNPDLIVHYNRKG